MSRKIVFLVIILSLLIPNTTLAYKPKTTHAGLTEQILEFYNLSFSENKIDKKYINLIIQGAIDEDNPEIRALNHFYDPIKNRGINYYGTAKEWALDRNTLNRYSWQKILRYYAEGDYDKAYYGLGHILHLIEDMSVPEHTRNDPHIGDGSKGLFTRKSPYEEWTNKYKKREDLKGLAFGLIKNKKAKNFNSLEEYFDFMANYSNNNFFSGDTIGNSIYNSPSISNINNGYIYNNGFRLAKLIKLTSGKNKFVLVDELNNDYSVLDSYFSRLSGELVPVGAGVVNLFFKEAEALKKEIEKQSKKKKKTLFHSLNNGIQKVFSPAGEIAVASVAIFKEVKKIGFGLGYSGAKLSGEVVKKTGEGVSEYVNSPSLSSNPKFISLVNDVVLSFNEDKDDVKPDESKVKNNQNNKESEDNFESSGNEFDIVSKNDKISIEDESTLNEVNNKEESVFVSSSTKDILALDSDIDIRQDINLKEQDDVKKEGSKKEPLDKNSVVGNDELKEPDIEIDKKNKKREGSGIYKFNFSGSVDSSSGKQAPKKEENQVVLDVVNDEDSNSVGENSDESTDTNKKSDESTSSSSDLSLDSDVGVSDEPKKVSFSSFLYDPSNKSLFISWSVDDDLSDAKELVFNLEYKKNSDEWESFLSEFSATSTSFLVEYDAQYNFRIQSKYKDSDTLSEWFLSDTFDIFKKPVLISEIAWMGTESSSSDEWIELYNNSNIDVDLNSWTLENSEKSLFVELEGFIKANSYYLLERTASTTTSINENMLYKGAMNNSGSKANLYLKDKNNLIQDYVTSWYFGDNEEKRSMERISFSVLGNVKENWSNFDGEVNAKDADGNGILGSPGKDNSVKDLYIYVSDDILKDTTWDKNGSLYYISHNIGIGEGVTLNIEPGVVVAFLGDKAGITVGGSILAKGSESDNIIFTSFYEVDNNENTKAKEGDWATLSFKDSGYSYMDNVQIKYAGAFLPPLAGTYLNTYNGALNINNSKLDISNCKFIDNLLYSIKLEKMSELNISDCNIENTKNHEDFSAFAIFSDDVTASSTISKLSFLSNPSDIKFKTASSSRHIISESVFEGGKDNIYIYGSLSDLLLKLENNSFKEDGRVRFYADIEDDFSFKKGIPYVLDFLKVKEDAKLNIEPGAVLKMSNSSRIEIKGELSSKGTKENRIIFTAFSDESGPGSWDFIEFSSTSATSSVAHTDFYFGGGNIKNSAVVLVKKGIAFFDNVVFRESIGGIFSFGESYVDVKNSHFEDIQNEAILANDNSKIIVRSSNILKSLNDTYTARANGVNARISALNNWWGDKSGPFHIGLNNLGLGGKIGGYIDFDTWSFDFLNFE